jgi:Flp pilus assembly protein TadG
MNGLTRLAVRRPGRRRGGSDRGAGAAEIVIAVPLLMLLILLVVQFAVWAHAASVAQATAEEALAAARVQGGSAAAGQQRASQVLGQIGSAVLIGPQVSVTRTAATATVQIHATAEQIIPLPGLKLPVTVTVTGPVERFVPETGGG